MAKLGNMARGARTAIVSKLMEATESWGVQQWTALLVIATTARPWVQPLLTTILQAIGVYLRGSMKEVLNKKESGRL